MTETRLTIQAHPCTIQLQVQGALIGLADPSKLHLKSPSGKWDLTVPAEAFAGISCEPGEVLIASLTLFRAAVEPVPEPLTNLNPPLILPGKAN